MARENANENDPKGAYGGDTGESDQKGKGGQAEKGDQRCDPSDHTAGNHTKGHQGRTGTRAG